MQRRGGRRPLPPGGGTKLFFAAFLALAGATFVVLALTTTGEAVDRTAAIVANTFIALFALMFFVPAYFLYRKVYPPRVRGVKVSVLNDEVRRGDNVEARLELRRPGKNGNVKVGLVCTEYYDVAREVNPGGGASPVTLEAVAWSEWQRGQPTDRTQIVRFEVPEDAPFTYRGECLSFGWDVIARRSRRGRHDRASYVPVTVRP